MATPTLKSKREVGTTPPSVEQERPPAKSPRDSPPNDADETPGPQSTAASALASTDDASLFAQQRPRREEIRKALFNEEEATAGDPATAAAAAAPAAAPSPTSCADRGGDSGEGATALSEEALMPNGPMVVEPLPFQALERVTFFAARVLISKRAKPGAIFGAVILGDEDDPLSLHLVAKKGDHVWAVSSWNVTQVYGTPQGVPAYVLAYQVHVFGRVDPMGLPTEAMADTLRNMICGHIREVAYADMPAQDGGGQGNIFRQDQQRAVEMTEQLPESEFGLASHTLPRSDQGAHDQGPYSSAPAGTLGGAAGASGPVIVHIYKSIRVDERGRRVRDEASCVRAFAEQNGCCHIGICVGALMEFGYGVPSADGAVYLGEGDDIGGVLQHSPRRPGGTWVVYHEAELCSDMPVNKDFALTLLHVLELPAPPAWSTRALSMLRRCRGHPFPEMPAAEELDRIKAVVALEASEGDGQEDEAVEEDAGDQDWLTSITSKFLGFAL